MSGLLWSLSLSVAYAIVNRLAAVQLCKQRRIRRDGENRICRTGASSVCASTSSDRSHSSLPPITFPLTYTVGPMVGQSDLCFRMLARAYGATVCYTPMLYTQYFMDEQYRRRVIDFDPSTTPTASPLLDRPLIVQFAANNPEQLLYAAKYVEHMCDAIDINLGCPQERALEGGYGSYLLARKHWSSVFAMILKLREAKFSKPVLCKIRLLDRYEDTLEFVLGLEAAGCSGIAIHGRKKGSSRSNRRRAGAADLDQIRKLKEALKIPVVANGNIRTYEDAVNNLAFTGCEGVMSAEGVLANPRLFSRREDAPDCIELAREYLDYCTRYPPPPLHWISDHIINICRRVLTDLKLMDIKSKLKSIGRDCPERVHEMHPLAQTPEEMQFGLARIHSLVTQIEVALHEHRGSNESLQSHVQRNREKHKNLMEKEVEQATCSLAGIFEE